MPRPSSRSLPVLPSSPLPPLYAGWMHEAFTAPLPTEQEATCNDCVMLPTEGRAVSAGATYFNPQSKCCTYVPELANFLVGRALADESAATGRATVQARLQAGISVTPFGLELPRQFKLLYQQSVNSFGRSQALRCPHYLAEENGNCGVWRHRSAICATWFCKHERGARGSAFWFAIKQLLAHVEQQLSQWCVLELDVGEAALRQLFQPLGKGGEPAPLDGAELDGKANPATQRALWGKWYGREEEFYRHCAKLVDGLRWADVLRHTGPATRAFLQVAQAALANVMNDALPTNLQVGAFQLVPAASGTLQAITYSTYDPLALSPRLLGLLPYFDGRATAAARQTILEQEHLKLNDALLRRLVDYGVLVAVE